MQDTKEIKNTTEIIEKFWSKIDKSSDCWIWLGKPGQDGYGKFYPIRTKTIRAHRFMYELIYGPIKKGMCVCHKCDNRLCVNPNHLFIGTHEDNVADMVRKGRNAKEESHGRAILTIEQVLEIRNTKHNTVKLAKKFGIHRDTILKIRRRDIWRHV